MLISISNFLFLNDTLPLASMIPGRQYGVFHYNFDNIDYDNM
ncbi:hypothetical protein D051_5280 [Vibrio parahaemolyticus VPCR-2010]|nr:hypothetical protein D051_5280 [Vibrio parahaemolyticus VPCR-2010]